MKTIAFERGGKIRLLFSLLALLLAGCTSQQGDTPVLRLATTTSTRDSGLIDVLIPQFEQDNDCRVDVIAVGTGAALKLGERGDADVLLAHASGAEVQFMQEGHGTRRETFMYNHFTILGPPHDPAGARGRDAVHALQLISGGRLLFVSRGDESGTHKKEKLLWEKAGGRPRWRDYLESGQGMGDTLMMADQLRAYVLSDRGTYLNFKDKIDLVPLVDQSELLRNDYSVIVVDGRKHERVNMRLAELFLRFLISADTQRKIDDYQLDGQPLFHASRRSE